MQTGTYHRDRLNKDPSTAAKIPKKRIPRTIQIRTQMSMAFAQFALLGFVALPNPQTNSMIMFTWESR